MYIEQWRLSPLQRRHLRTSHSSPSLHQLPCHIFLNLIDGPKSLPLQKWFEFWEKPEITRHQVWAVGGLSHLGDFEVLPKKSAQGMLSWWSCQSPVARGCGPLHHTNSFHGGKFKLNAKFDAAALLRWLVQWSHCSLTHVPVHCPSLPGYIDVTQAILAVLKMAGIFPDRPRRMRALPYVQCCWRTEGGLVTWGNPIEWLTGRACPQVNLHL